MKNPVRLAAIYGILFLVACQSTTDKKEEISALATKVQVIGNIEYAKVDSTSLLLDVYVPAKKLGEDPWIEYSDELKPTLLYIHGGGWVSGNKISRSLQVMPYVEAGWCVVNADYRLLQEASLGEIVGDCRQALNWIYDNAEKYKFDTTKIVVSGESAGGHLSLTTGLIENDEDYFGGVNPFEHELKVAAIVNWFGVSDLDLATNDWGDDYINQVVQGADQDSLYQITSPVNFLAQDAPPIITIHGDADTSAPYEQGALLHKRLDELGVKNILVTVPGKKHGNFTPEEQKLHFKEIWKFLAEVGI